MDFVTVLVNLAVQLARLQPANLNFHVRDLFPPAFWFNLPITVRMQIGRKFYYATAAGFVGFDVDHVAVYG
jgi:hypothetical protein